mmetsp:Transcript_20528/g.55241  ORF Transcript_20528/g.55241 Transcript_20528/m.55241 type:complete len:226 (-) Transcript_20528:249-926(-)|eukprot:CAMPEP_0185160572 /NCGR_PEP_ID=MMETSP1139-20130426/3720_1 /TAXON_ID=298111 /ORGANISM="Pavlova sp., Strain CCMP459" /LENGTH=225 /DNA_ID=CAMNT_0027725781 /DNA_START=44 /DNA_END=721 /DNA_ORIENTATION=+
MSTAHQVYPPHTAPPQITLTGNSESFRTHCDRRRCSEPAVLGSQLLRQGQMGTRRRASCPNPAKRPMPESIRILILEERLLPYTSLDAVSVVSPTNTSHCSTCPPTPDNSPRSLSTVSPPSDILSPCALRRREPPLDPGAYGVADIQACRAITTTSRTRADECAHPPAREPITAPLHIDLSSAKHHGEMLGSSEGADAPDTDAAGTDKATLEGTSPRGIDEAHWD